MGAGISLSTQYELLVQLCLIQAAAARDNIRSKDSRYAGRSYFHLTAVSRMAAMEFVLAPCAHVLLSCQLLAMLT